MLSTTNSRSTHPSSSRSTAWRDRRPAQSSRASARSPAPPWPSRSAAAVPPRALRPAAPLPPHRPALREPRSAHRPPPTRAPRCALDRDRDRLPKRLPGFGEPGEIRRIGLQTRQPIECAVVRRLEQRAVLHALPCHPEPLGELLLLQRACRGRSPVRARRAPEGRHPGAALRQRDSWPRQHRNRRRAARPLPRQPRGPSAEPRRAGRLDRAPRRDRDKRARCRRRGQELATAQPSRGEAHHALELGRRGGRLARPPEPPTPALRAPQERVRAAHPETRVDCSRDRRAGHDPASRPRARANRRAALLQLAKTTPRHGRNAVAGSLVGRSQRKNREIVVERAVTDGVGEPAFSVRERGLARRAVSRSRRRCRLGRSGVGDGRRTRVSAPAANSTTRDGCRRSRCRATRRRPRRRSTAPAQFGNLLDAATPWRVVAFAAASRSCKRRAVADSIKRRVAPVCTGLISSR